MMTLQVETVNVNDTMTSPKNYTKVFIDGKVKAKALPAKLSPSPIPAGAEFVSKMPRSLPENDWIKMNETLIRYNEKYGTEVSEGTVAGYFILVHGELEKVIDLPEDQVRGN